MKRIKTLGKTLFFTFTTLLLSACALPGIGGQAGEESISIAGLASTEGQIMAFMVEGMVEHYMDVDAQVVNNLGTSSMAHQAMVNGDVNITGVKYTGTSLTGDLGRDPITDPELAYDTVVELFAEEHQQKWFPTYGFANTYAFMVTQELAEEHDLETISDLEPIAGELMAGVDNSWMEREGDGYRAFLDTYEFDFQRVTPMQIGLVYDALQAGEMDIVLGYSTDGRIASYDLVVLEDDRQLFPPYDASPLASYEVLEAYPQLESIFLKMENTITNEQMQELNFAADNNLIEPKVVATQFLEENNYFEDKEPFLESANNEGGDTNG